MGISTRSTVAIKAACNMSGAFSYFTLHMSFGGNHCVWVNLYEKVPQNVFIIFCVVLYGE